MLPSRRAWLLVAGLLLAGCATSAGVGDTPAAGAWQQLPRPPLTPRLQAVTAWTGTEALFLGGDTGPPCPAGASCAPNPVATRDGAAFDPARGTWRRTADSPVPIGPSSPSVVVGDAVYLVTAGRLLSYDASADAWTTHDGPQSGLDGVLLATDGSRVLAARSERRTGDPPDELYDPATGTWTPIPADPLGATFDRLYVGTPAGLVLTAKSLVAAPGVEPPFVRAAVLHPASLGWTSLPDSRQVGGWRWTWTGSRLVDAELGGADGGEVDSWGHTYPFGGTLDPATATWGTLTRTPPGYSGGWRVEASGGPLAAIDGWIYDDRAATWTRLSPPGGGPTQPGSAVWAGRRLVVLGGTDSGPDGDRLSAGAWLYDPAGAAGGDPHAAPGITGNWEFVEGSSGGSAISLPRSGRGTLSADATRVSGTAFCNGYGARYRLEGDRLLLTDLVATAVGCIDADRTAAEGAFLAVLGAGGTRVSRTAHSLTLANPTGMLRFRPETPVPASALVGTRWVLESLVDHTTASSTVGEPALLRLDQDGTFTASTGCRPLSGRWTASGDTVTVDDEVSLISCPAGVARQDQQVLDVLGGGFRAAVAGDRLTLTADDGLALVYRTA